MNALFIMLMLGSHAHTTFGNNVSSTITISFTIAQVHMVDVDSEAIGRGLWKVAVKDEMTGSDGYKRNRSHLVYIGEKDLKNGAYLMVCDGRVIVENAEVYLVMDWPEGKNEKQVARWFHRHHLSDFAVMLAKEG